LDVRFYWCYFQFKKNNGRNVEEIEGHDVSNLRALVWVCWMSHWCWRYILGYHKLVPFPLLACELLLKFRFFFIRMPLIFYQNTFDVWQWKPLTPCYDNTKKGQFYFTKSYWHYKKVETFFFYLSKKIS